MSTFAAAVKQLPDSYTENGADTFASSLSTHTDLFFRIGASRGKAREVVELFQRALKQDASLAIRIALWARDARGGAGEREIFREAMKVLSRQQQLGIIPKVVELGRWDDLGVLVMTNDALVSETAARFWQKAVLDGQGLAAKWAPRKGELAVRLRTLWKMSPKQYRKTLVTATKVVEQQMCAKQWDDIEFAHVPSVAAARYNAAFYRNAPEQYKLYKEALVKGETRINASAIFPHDVIRAAFDVYPRTGPGVDADVVNAQWNALPDYCAGKANDILVMSDVSGSMMTAVSGSVTAMHVSLALGLYISERQTGAFKDMILTFSSKPVFHTVHGNGITERAYNLSKSDWGMTTNINAAFKAILEVAVNNKVPQAEMPKMLLILSDMEFDYCGGNQTNFQAAEKLFEAAGYVVPKVIFWNLNASKNNLPVRFDTNGTALVSGFSPAILTAILGAEHVSPHNIMLEAVMKDRYSVPGITF